MKLDTAIPICKSCMRDIKSETVGSLLNDNPIICPTCFRELKPHIQQFRINGVLATALYEYTERAKSIIYSFKGCFDYELREIFISRQAKYLATKYRGWIIVPAPSYHEKDVLRGFNHVEAMFSVLGLPMIKAISKSKDVKQADLSKDKRAKIGECLEWNNGVNIRGKNVLFVDDILTTGSTASAICKMIKEHGANKVEILIGFHTMKDEKLSLFERIKRSFIAYDLS